MEAPWFVGARRSAPASGSNKHAIDDNSESSADGEWSQGRTNSQSNAAAVFR